MQIDLFKCKADNNEMHSEAELFCTSQFICCNVLSWWYFRTLQDYEMVNEKQIWLMFFEGSKFFFVIVLGNYEVFTV